MANGIKKFIDDNTKGPVNKAFLALSIAEIAQSDNKLKALLKTLRDMLLFKPLIAIGLAGAFAAMGKSIRALVKDTGSLKGALDKLRQIQGLQRLFAPFVGGMDAAKLKVAELVNFASRAKLKLDGVTEAEHSLQDLTHGAYTGAAALQVIADAGAASGNGIAESARGVGEFYAALREGRPIQSAADNLRSMGLISDESSRQLVDLQQAGKTNAEVFEALTKTLQRHKGALAAMQGDLAAVEDRYEAVSELLKEKLGEPFSESEIQNTKNMADAMTALVPLVSRVAPFLEKLTNGFSTVASSMAKWAAENPKVTVALGNLIEIGATLIGVFSAVATITIAAWLLGAAGAATGLASAFIALTGATGVLATAITTLGAVARLAMIASGVGLLIALATTAYGVYMNFAHAADAAAEAQERVRKRHDEVNAAMEKQIANARNLREAHEALSKAASNTASAYQAYQDALAEQATEQAGKGWEGVKGRVMGWFGGESTFTSSKETDAKVEAAKAQYLKARELEKKAKSKFDPKQGYVSPERAAADREVQGAQAAMTGNSERIVSLRNLDNFAQTFEKMREIYGDKEGAVKAGVIAKGDIAANASVGADRLARLGLGGEAGGTDVQKQVRDLTRDIASYLKSIDAKIGGSGPANKAMSLDDNPL